MSLIETLHAKIRDARSKPRQYLWWGVLAVVAFVFFLGLLIRRRMLIGNVSTLRQQLAQQERRLTDARVSAETAKDRAEIQAHRRNAEAIEHDVALLRRRVELEEQEHQKSLEDINAARSWTDLEQIRSKANSR